MSMVNVDQIKNGIHDYATKELVPKASGLTKFGVYMALPSLDGMVDTYVDKFSNTPFADGIIDDDGYVDIDVLHERAKDAMTHCHHLDMLGFRFDADDIDRLYDAIMRG